MIKIAHEAPLSLMRDIRSVTDYDYALVHLFEDETLGEEYFRFFKESRLMGREVILDNSIFELGEAFDTSKYIDWIVKLKPTYFILPDVLDNGLQTVRSASDFFLKFPAFRSCNSKVIGVTQGGTFTDLMKCFEWMNSDPRVDKIAVSFDYKFYEEICPHKDKLYSWMYGRQWFMNIIARDFPNCKPVHLLGCALPQEGEYYKTDSKFNFIESIDTSNPIIHGLLDQEYEMYGLDHKESIKVVELFNAEKPTFESLRKIYSNIKRFKNFWNG